MSEIQDIYEQWKLKAEERIRKLDEIACKMAMEKFPIGTYIRRKHDDIRTRNEILGGIVIAHCVDYLRIFGIYSDEGVGYNSHTTYKYGYYHICYRYIAPFEVVDYVGTSAIERLLEEEYQLKERDSQYREKYR